ncbi:hypothetical protein JCM16307_20240 [Thermococcus prieurii]
MEARLVGELSLVMSASEREILEAIRRVRLRPRVSGLRFEGSG